MHSSLTAICWLQGGNVSLTDNIASGQRHAGYAFFPVGLNQKGLGVTTIDAHGMFVTPGLIDAHVHFSQTGWADGRPDALDLRATHPYDKTEADLKANPERYAKSYVCSGVTSVFDVGGYPWTLKLEGRFANDTMRGRSAVSNCARSSLRLIA